MKTCSECLAANGGHFPTCSHYGGEDKVTMKSTDQILAERGKEYGSFVSHADITQQIKEVYTESPNWHRMVADQKESLEMIAHKIGRILNGNPNNIDSWADIAGYAKLVADRLQGVVR